MPEQTYKTAAIAAALLALLFPLYWGGVFWNIVTGNTTSLYHDISGLNPSDVLFLVIGVLMMFVYLKLKHFLNDRHAFHSADVPLLLLAITSGVFTLGSLMADAFMQFHGDSLGLGWHHGFYQGQTIALVVSTMIFGILDIILGILLFTKAREFSDLLKIFAVIIVIQGVFELTIIFSQITSIIFPVAMIMLAILFSQKPDMIEVV